MHWRRHIPLLIIVAGILSLSLYQFLSGYHYQSNDTTTSALQWGRASSYALLALLTVLWLPVLRVLTNFLYRLPIARWAAPSALQRLHRYAGYLVFCLGSGHAIGYLTYYHSLDAPFFQTVMGTEPDLVRSMRTSMYEFVSDDESIHQVHAWIKDGAQEASFDQIIRPIMKEDCTKCHSQSSTQTYAIPRIPLITFEEVHSWTKQGVQSHQFRVNMTGVGLFLCMLVISVLALPVVRRKHYHLFQLSHRLSYVLGGLLLLHVPHHWLWLVSPVLALYLTRLLDRSQHGLTGTCQQINENLLRLTITPKTAFLPNTGDYVLLRLSALSREWHAFSVTQSSHDECVVKIRRAGDWTQALFALPERTTLVDMRGPYRSVCVASTQQQQLWLLGGGIGITPFLHLLRQRSHPARFVGIIWSLRDADEAALLLSDYDTFKTNIDRLHVTLYLSQGSWPTSFLTRWPEVFFRQGRPDFDELDNHSCDAVFICGSRSFGRAAHSAARRRGYPTYLESFQS